MIVDKGPIVRELLEFGRKVFVFRGQLKIIPPLPPGEFKEKFESMASEIVTTCGINGYLYQDYKTGRYGKQKFEGITLQFLNLRNGGSPAYTIFNADLSRKRSSKHGNAGSPLPGKQFRVSRGHKFFRFWLKTGLSLPPRLSSFHDYMGNLRSVIFTGPCPRGQRISKDTLEPLMLTHDEILNCFGIQSANREQTSSGQTPDNVQTNAIHHPDNGHAQSTYKETLYDQQCREAERNTAAGASNRECTAPGEYAHAEIPGYGDAETRKDGDDFNCPY